MNAEIPTASVATQAAGRASYYLGDHALSEHPFDEVNTCPIYIIPNFGTLEWDTPTPEAVAAHMRQLQGAEGALNDEIMMYVHVPFCTSYCHYCNFARDRFPWRDHSVLDKYTDYLIKEIDYYLDEVPYVHTRRFTALYIGGGSPSTLGAANVDRLLTHLARKIPNWSSIEKTFTGEPKTLKETGLINVLVAHAVDRITFGIESLDPAHRKYIGRTDKVEDIDSVFSGLESAGFRGDTCADFMFNHPGQTFEQMKEDLDRVIHEYQPTELDTYNTIYVPYRPLHKLVLKGKVPQPANIRELLRMREYLYDALSDNGYHNPIAETYSKKPERTQYQTAHCARQDIIGIGVGARGNFKDMVSINPATTEAWTAALDERRYSTQTLQTIGRDGVLKRIMVMWPRYMTLSKRLFESFADVKSYAGMRRILQRHLERGVCVEHEHEYRMTKLGVLWHPNMQWDYMHPDLNIWGRVIGNHFGEPKRRWDQKERFQRTPTVRVMDYFTDKFPKLMK
jgi:coproporphyrinogen III oxidase-like Fe-S oxidoreductase